jgi:AcrR family transcriptional regulator
MRVSRADRTLSRTARSRRDAVLEAALAAIARKGFHETSIADIAGCARVSRATIYQYFRDKRDIFRTLTDRVAQRIIGAVDAWGPLPRPPGDGAAAADPPRALVGQLRAMVETRIAQVFAAVSANADAARLVLLLSRPNDSPVDEATRRIDDHVVGILARELQLTSGYGWTRSCDPSITAATLRSTTRPAPRSTASRWARRPTRRASPSPGSKAG